MKRLLVLPALAGLALSAAIGALGTPAVPSIAGAPGCPVFPSDSPWNQRVDSLPASPNSQAFIGSIGAGSSLHPDFGAFWWDGGPVGIPFVVVPGTQPRVPVSFGYASESDPGPYPIPPGAPIEGGSQSTGDRHVLVVDRDACKLYELYAAYPGSSGWSAGSGAVFDLRSDALRPSGWTSADAAGLPILPGLVRYDEVAGGSIDHAIRFTAPRTQRAYVYPARHWASGSADRALPPMGLRLRLDPGFDIGGYPADDQVILTALKRYGMILADNGSPFYISGTPDARWNDGDLNLLKRLKGSDFQVVDARSLPTPGLNGSPANAPPGYDPNDPIAVRPAISTLSPVKGTAGTQVTLTGTGFAGATAVAFNGAAAATFAVVSDTRLTATVPAAAQSGPITVTTPGGTGTSATGFSVLRINRVTPAGGPVGATVTLAGTGFLGASAVRFNGTSAAFTVNSSSSITTTVPTGATSGPVAVTTTVGTATSATAFTVG